MKLLDGPFVGIEIDDVVQGAFLVIPSYVQCDKPGCLFNHFQTDEYWLRGPNAGRWYRAYVSLADPEPDDANEEPEA